MNGNGLEIGRIGNWKQQLHLPDQLLRFSQQFERWLNRSFPVTEDGAKANYEREAANYAKHNSGPISECDLCSPNAHRVVNKAIGGTDICLLARMIKLRMAPGGDPIPVLDDQANGGSDDQTLMSTLESADLVMLEYAEVRMITKPCHMLEFNEAKPFSFARMNSKTYSGNPSVSLPYKKPNSRSGRIGTTGRAAFWR